jgi:hypothetical protein
MFHLFQNNSELAAQSLIRSKTKHLRELVGGEAEQPQIAGTLIELVDGEIASEDKVATVFDLL